MDNSSDKRINTFNKKLHIVKQQVEKEIMDTLNFTKEFSKPKVVLTKQIKEKLLMQAGAFIAMLKSKRPSSQVAERSGLSRKTIQNLRKKFSIEVK